MIRVAVDAMGGDYAPGEIVKGAVQAAEQRKDIQIVLIGQEEVVREELKKYSFQEGQITVQNATEVIATEEPPVIAIRKKKDSSLVVGMNMVKRGEADAIVSAGSSGAILVGGQVIVGRIKGVERPPLAPLIPTEKGCPCSSTAGPMWTPGRPTWCSLPGWGPSTWSMWWASKTPGWPSSTSGPRRRRETLW